MVSLLLLHKASPDAHSSSGNYPLRAAIASGDGECILALLDAGANVDMETASVVRGGGGPEVGDGECYATPLFDCRQEARR